jgi:hypothetical protein
MMPITAENPFTPEQARALLSRFPAHVRITPGMSERELDEAEERGEFRFAPEHRTLLGEGLPLGGRSWPDWRDGTAEDLAERLACPREGVLFDVEFNGVWHPDWGTRPAEPGDALDLARERLASVPVMVPVCSHRYLLGDPDRTGTPVLSMHQTDIIYYGADLADYFRHEFGGWNVSGADFPVIPFWSHFID